VEVKAAGSLEIAHTRNFIDAIAAQRAPSTPIETGLDGLRPCFLARQAYWDRHS
jgi:hypothetical protein